MRTGCIHRRRDTRTVTKLHLRGALEALFAPPLEALGAAALLGLLLQADAISAAESVPIPVQAVIINKLMRFSRTLEDQSVHVVVAYGAEGDAESRAMTDALRAAGLTAEMASLTDLSEHLDQANVVYFVDEVGAARELCEKHEILTITGQAALVEGGEVAVGFALQDNKPKILVHWEELSAVNHRFQSDLLRLARVIR